MISDLNVYMMLAVLVLVVLFGIGSHFVFKFDDMEIKSIKLKIVKAIVVTLTVAVGFTLVVIVRNNTDMFMAFLHG